MFKLYKKIFYYKVKRDLKGLLEDLAKGDYLPEIGKILGKQVVLKFVEYSTSIQELKFLQKDLERIIAGRAELLLVKSE